MATANMGSSTCSVAYLMKKSVLLEASHSRILSSTAAMMSTRRGALKREEPLPTNILSEVLDDVQIFLKNIWRKSSDFGSF